MTTILTRLAGLAQKKGSFYAHPCDYVVISALEDAAREIERLHSEIVRYRTALNKIAHPCHYEDSADSLEKAVGIALAAVVIKDRQKLKPKEVTS